VFGGYELPALRRWMLTATGAELDVVAGMYRVTRLRGETDESLRTQLLYTATSETPSPTVRIVRSPEGAIGENVYEMVRDRAVAICRERLPKPDPIAPFRNLLEAIRLPVAIEAVRAEWKRKHPAGEVSWDMRRGGADLPAGLYLQLTFRLGPWPPVYAWICPEPDEEQVTEAIETAWRWMANSIAKAWKPEVRK